MCDRGGFPPGHPLARAAARRGTGGDPAVLASTAGSPHGRWIRADRLAEDRHIVAWLADIRADGYDQQHAAAVKMCDVFTQALLGVTVQAVYLDGCAPDLSGDNVWIRREGARITQVALGRGTTAVLADRPAGTHPEAIVVPDADALNHWIAERIAATFIPVFQAIHRHTRMGLRVMWGRVADLVHAQALRAAKDLGYDTYAAWACAEALTDAIAHAVPKMGLRPRPFPVTGFDRYGGDWQGTWLVFGTCCFRYKANPERGFCNVCPLIADTERSFSWLHTAPPAPTAASAP